MSKPYNQELKQLKWLTSFNNFILLRKLGTFTIIETRIL